SFGIPGVGVAVLSTRGARIPSSVLDCVLLDVGGRYHQSNRTSPFAVNDLRSANLERTLVKTAVVALGKIGLPLAVQFADAGHEVVGVDVNARQVELINAATEPFPGEAHLQEKLSELVPAGR